MGRSLCGWWDGTAFHNGFDTGGLARSSGTQLLPWNKGLMAVGTSYATTSHQVCGGASDGTTSVVVTGNSTSGGIWVRNSTAGWTRASSQYFSNGQTPGLGGVSDAVRETGRKVAYCGSTWWVACRDTSNANQPGIARSTDSGSTWSSWLAANQQIAGLFVSPNFQTAGSVILYYGVREDNSATGTPGVYLVQNADATATHVRIDNVGTGAPTFAAAVRDIFVANEGGSDVLYCVVSSADATHCGVWKCVVGNPTSGWSASSVTWTNLTGTLSNTTDWNSIVGMRSGSNTYLIIGTYAAKTGLTAISDTYTAYDGSTQNYYPDICRSTDSGSTWQSMISGAGVSVTIYGTSLTWELATTDDINANQARMGGHLSGFAQLTLGSDGTLYASHSQRGPWRCDNPWATTPSWQPFVDGMGTSIARSVAVNTANTNQAMIPDVDDSSYRWLDAAGGAAIGYYQGTTSAHNGRGIFEHNGTLLLGTNGGSIIYSSNIWTSTPPTFTTSTVAASGNIDATIRFTNATGSIVDLAYETNTGEILRSTDGSGTTWTVVATLGAVQKNDTCGKMFVHATGNSNNVWLFTPQGAAANAGLWWSGDAGQTWTLIWAKNMGSSLWRLWGRIAMHATDETTLFATTTTAGIYKITNAASATPTVTTLASSAPYVSTTVYGPITVDPTNGDLVVCAPANAVGGADILLSSDYGVTWTSIADSSYAEISAIPTDIVKYGSRIYVPQDGSGMVYADTGSAPAAEVWTYSCNVIVG